MTNVQQVAAQELLRRQDALDNMRNYRRYIEPSGEPDFMYEPADHHDTIIDALHFLEYGQDWDGNPVSKVLIMLPPGSAKSTYGSVQFPTWYLARNPTHNILACSNTTDLAENFNRRRRNVILSKEWQSLSETSIDKNAQGLGLFQTESRGSMKAAGVGSSIVGTRANLFILDDPISSFEEAMSNSQLEKIWAWYSSDARSRLVPGGKELMITTRWAKNDPAGRILDLIESGHEKGWHVVRLPMLADSPDDLLGRAYGAPLWPEHFTQEQIDRNIRDPLIWSSQYQQVPLDESGSWVDESDIRYVTDDQVPEDLNVVIAVDLALSEGKGDFTVFVVAGLDSDRNIFILDVIRRRQSADRTANDLIDLVAERRPNDVLIEDDPAASVFHNLSYEIARQRGTYLPLQKMPIRGKDKETRAAAIRGMFRQGKVLIREAPWNTDLYSEIYGFPNGPHDDQIDCLGMIGLRVPMMSTPKPPTSKNAIEELMFLDERGVHILDRPLHQLFQDREDMQPRYNRDRI